jgi:hypothetical protein
MVRVACVPHGSNRNRQSWLLWRQTEDVLRLIADVYPGMEAAKNVIQTSLQNANPVIHPAVSLANAARIERTGNFLFYEEGGDRFSGPDD